jgi:mannose-6-phosphate isomerase-like protein (cupin superfamily)
MHHIATTKHRRFFEVLAQSSDAQAAMMTLRPGQSTSDKPENEHPRCEQWLYVIRGIARATVGNRSATLKPGSLLLIEKGEPHRITNTGRTPLATLNLYVPPAYTSAGDVRALARVPSVLKTLRLKK